LSVSEFAKYIEITALFADIVLVCRMEWWHPAPLPARRASKPEGRA